MLNLYYCMWASSNLRHLRHKLYANGTAIEFAVKDVNHLNSLETRFYRLFTHDNLSKRAFAAKQDMLLCDKPVEACFQTILVIYFLFHKRAFTANSMAVPFLYNL